MSLMVIGSVIAGLLGETVRSLLIMQIAVVIYILAGLLAVALFAWNPNASDLSIKVSQDKR